MGLLGSMSVKIGADTSALSAGVSIAKSILSSLVSGNPTEALAVGFATLGTAAIGFGVSSVKAAADFQSSMNLLATSAGESTSNLKMVGDGIMDIAVKTGTSTQQLSAGMYMVESAGWHGKAGLDVLKVAAMGARSEGADLNVVTNALTTTMTDYHMKTSQASSAMNGLIATVANGKTHLQDLSSAMGVVLPLASSVHVGFAQVGAAMATMTNNGESARHAAQMVAFMLRDMVAPSGVAAKAMASVGLATKDVSDTLQHQGLPQALQLIEDHVGKKFPAGSAEWTAAMKKIMGGALGLSGALQIGGQHMATFTGNVANITKAMADGSKGVSGWDVVQTSFNFKMSQAREIIETLSIKIGQQLLPIATTLVAEFVSLASGFSSVASSASPLSPILQTISGMIKIMIINWQSSASAFVPAEQAFQRFGILLSTLLPGAISQVMLALNNLNTIIGIVAVAVSAWISPALSILGQIFKGLQQAIAPILNTVEGQLLPAFQSLVSSLAPIITGFLTWIANAHIITPLLAGLGTAISVVIKIVSVLITVIASIITFFTQTQVGVALLQAVLVTLAVVLTTIALIVLPGLIAGFVATAASAIATGISIAIAFLPITLIVLGIIAVVALVILAIKNWGAISAWLQGAWSNVAAFFTGIWTKITGAFGNAGNWFHDRFQQAQDGVKSGFGNTANWFQQQGTNIKNIATNIGQGVVTAFNWMYQHNTYFKEMVDAIIKFGLQLQSQLSSIWNTISSNATSAWNNFRNTVVGIWNFLYGNARSIFANISSSITSTVSSSISSVQSQWNSGVSWINAKWQMLRGLAESAWSAVRGVFASAWSNYIAGPLNSLWSNITGWWNSVVVGGATSLGSSLMNGIASGISNAGGAVGNAIHSAVSGALSGLGFHGIPGFAGGVSNFGGGFAMVGENGPELVKLPAGSSVYPTGTGPSGAVGSSSGSAASSSFGSSSSGPVHIILQIDGQTIATAVAPAMVSEIRATLGYGY